MTIQSDTRIAGPFVGDGAVVNLDFKFKIFEAAELIVTVRDALTFDDTVLVLTTDYSVTINANQDTLPGGRVTLVAALAADTMAYIEGVPSFLQEIVFTNTGGFYPTVLNSGLDLAAMRDIYILDRLKRAATSPVGIDPLVIPDVFGNEGKFLAVDASDDLYWATGAAGDSGLRTDLAAPGGDALVNGVRNYVATRAALALVPVAEGKTVWLNEGYRVGFFRWVLGNYAARTAADTLQGLYVASSVSAVTVGCWVRIWDGVNGLPEWFGVVPSVSSGGTPAANTTAINAALVLLPVAVFGALDYYCTGTVKHLTPNGVMRGVGSLYNDVYGYRATRLLGTDATSDILQIGPDANPGSIGQFPEGVKTYGLQVQRATAPGVGAGAASIRVQFVLEAYIEDVRADESIIGWVFNGTVATIVNRCSAKRTTAGSGGTDSWKGFYINGGSGIAAGGNASLYITYSHADDTRSVKTNSVGFYADQKFTDLFLDHIETVSCTVGIELNGNSATTNDGGNTDVRIIHPTMDAFAVYGIYIHNLGIAGGISITDPYLGPAAGATSAIQIGDNKGGSVTITGGHLTMGSAPTCKGITIEVLSNKSGAVAVLGTMIQECGANGAVVMDSAIGCRILPTVMNNVVTGGPAVQVINACAANYIAPVVTGKASGVTKGIEVIGTTDVRNEYNLSGIDSGCVAGGSGNKLVRNAVQITATGLTGTNLASGVVT